MSEKSNISWTDSTHNFWRGCSKVSTGCENCYAEKLVTGRLGGEWGPGGLRVRSKDFNAPLRWNKKPWLCDQCERVAIHDRDGNRTTSMCQCRGTTTFHRRRVFSLSLGDWLEGDPLQWKCGCGAWQKHHQDLSSKVCGQCGGDIFPIGGIPVSWLADMLDVIRRCDQLSWILCTKRPENFHQRLEAAQDYDFDHGKRELCGWLRDWRIGAVVPPNVTILASVENQEQADKRIPQLLGIPAARRGLSLEPLLSDVKLACVGNPPLRLNDTLDGVTRNKLDWYIVGGESGPKARHCNVEWIRSIVEQGKAAGVPVFVKQLGSSPMADVEVKCDAAALKGLRGVENRKLKLKHRSGADPAEWPEDLRVRQFPQGL